MKRLAALAAQALLLSLAACGGSPGAAKTVTVTQTSTATTTATETQTETADATTSTEQTTDEPASDTLTSYRTSSYSADEATTEAATDTATADVPSAAGGGEVDAAVSSARSYLDTSAFSKQGLIDQLSSEYGEKFPLSVATKAVNSLTDVDWNAQAVKAAQSYLDGQSFSCQGLTDQLSSSYGSKFTPSQAAYGAGQTPVCK